MYIYICIYIYLKKGVPRNRCNSFAQLRVNSPSHRAIAPSRASKSSSAGGNHQRPGATSSRCPGRGADDWEILGNIWKYLTGYGWEKMFGMRFGNRLVFFFSYMFFITSLMS